MIGKTVYFDGRFLPAGKAMISPFDRGFLFSHAAYEVTAVVAGRLIDAEGHAARLTRTLKGVEIPWTMPAEDLIALQLKLARQNGLEEGLVYLQVTAGAYGERDFAGPDVFSPSVFLFTAEKILIDTPAAREGIGAVLVADMRWKRRDMKTTQLLSQAQAYRTARVAGAVTAWMHEDGFITEAASANAWIVINDEIITRPLGHDILAGITRERIAELARVQGLNFVERAFTPQEVQAADEAFTSSAGAMVLPVTHLDDLPIGSGQPGPVTRQIQRLYFEHAGVDLTRKVPWVLET